MNSENARLFSGDFPKGAFFDKKQNYSVQAIVSESQRARFLWDFHSR